MGRGKAKKCASKWRKKCRSSSTSLINLKNHLGSGNVFSKAFNLWKIAKHQFRGRWGMLSQNLFTWSQVLIGISKI